MNVISDSEHTLLALNLSLYFSGTWYHVIRTTWQIHMWEYMWCRIIQVKQKERLNWWRTPWIRCL